MSTYVAVGYLLLLVAGTAALALRDYHERMRHEAARQVRTAVLLGMREIDAIAANTLASMRARAEGTTPRDAWDRW